MARTGASALLLGNVAAELLPELRMKERWPAVDRNRDGVIDTPARQESPPCLERFRVCIAPTFGPNNEEAVAAMRLSGEKPKYTNNWVTPADIDRPGVFVGAGNSATSPPHREASTLKDFCPSIDSIVLFAVVRSRSTHRVQTAAAKPQYRHDENGRIRGSRLAAIGPAVLELGESSIGTPRKIMVWPGPGDKGGQPARAAREVVSCASPPFSSVLDGGALESDHSHRALSIYLKGECGGFFPENKITSKVSAIEA
ncbi:hypothetical protein C8Q78DRAFT_989339 [Trametes maxima]|nr:hypothetical protein C8Q78DRAFT_989339 [Trametes maxima]